MLRVGIAGFGFMGRTHYNCWRDAEDAKVVAICDVNPNIIEDTTKAVGNIGNAKPEIEFLGLNIYTDFDRMLSEEKLNAVSISLPTYLHADCSIKALSAGINVLCEKPIALNVADCKRMITAAKQSGKVLQIGHCVRFWPEYARAKQIVDSGEYGRVVAASFRRLSALPTWGQDNWFLDEKRSGGMPLDLHIHDTDFVQYLFGVPHAVCSFAVEAPGRGLVHIVTQYLYEDDKVVTAEGSWSVTSAFGFEMSFNIILEKATLIYDLTRQPTFKVCPAGAEAFVPDIEKGDGWSLQIAHFAKIIKGEKVEQVTTLEQSLNSVKIVQAEKESVVRKEKVCIS